MRKWNATMPKQKAAPGGADVVLAYRASDGSRFELECKMTVEAVQAVMRQAIDSMKNYKANAPTDEGEKK